MIKILKLDYRIIPVAKINISRKSILHDILDDLCFIGQKKKILLSQN